MATTYWLYLLQCGDGSLYCGIARNVQARLLQHQRGTGAKYTRGRGPLTLLLSRRCRDKGTALRLEHAVKQLSRVDKLALVTAPASLARLARHVARATAVRAS